MSKIDVEWEKIKTELMNENYNDFFNIFKKILKETLGYAGEILNKEDIKLLKYNLYTLDGLYIIDIHKFIEKGDILDYVVDKNGRRSFNYNRYYQISGELLSIEEYLDIFKDNFKDDWKYYYDRFLSEYPVLEYLSKTEKKRMYNI